MVFSALDLDTYKARIFKPALAQLDNYQIYSVIAIDYPSIETILSASPSSYGNNGGYGLYSYSNSWYGMKVYEDYQVNRVEEGGKFLAFQTYGIQKPDFNFVEIARNCIVQPRNIYNYTTYTQEYVDDAAGYLYPTVFAPQYDPSNIQPYLQQISAQPVFSDASFGEPWYFRNFGTAWYFGDVNTGQGAYTYLSAIIYRFLFQNHFTSATAPNYKDLLRGYSNDTRGKPPNRPKIICDLSGEIEIKYYRQNPYESHPLLDSIDWREYRVKIEQGKQIELPIIDPVFGTLIINGNADLVAKVKLKLSQINLPNDRYKYSHYYYVSDNIPSVWQEWLDIYNSINLPAEPDENNNFARKRYQEYQTPILRVLAANNNCWDNDSTDYQDLNFDASHPLFAPLNDLKIFNYHFKPQTDGSFGNIPMDSPRLLEIHAALDAAKFATNSIESNNPRVTNLGFLIEQIASLLGLRLDDNGKVDHEKEKKLVKRGIAKSDEIDPAKIGVNSFGQGGRLVRRLNNRFKGKEIVNDEILLLRDLPQLLGEFHEQNNIANNIQESSAIKIETADGTATFNNTLELLIEIFSLIHDNQNLTRSTLVSSLVSQGQTSEIIAGIGLPSTTKTIILEVDGKNKELPYKGIAEHRSLTKEIAVATYNAGLATGQNL